MVQNQNNMEPAGKQPARNEKTTRLEESSIFAPRPRLEPSGKMQEQKAKKAGAGRAWLLIVALLAVIGIALIFSSGTAGMGLTGGSQLSGAAGADAETATPTSTNVPTAEMTFTPTVTFTPTLTIGASLIRPSDGMVMMYVPAGPFTMGTTVDEAMAECVKTRGECEPAWFTDEAPPHIVELDAYWMDQTEVTNAMYAQCVNAGGCQPPRLNGSNTVEEYFNNPAYIDYPVVFVPWKQADNYCRWAGARLPTEAEWEKAARGTDERVYPWGNARPNCSLSNINPFNANACRDDVGAVRYYADGQSPYQIYNMAGNVAEWVMDWYGENYYANSPVSNPQGPADGVAKILRGGSWYFDEDYARTTYRYKQDARYYYSFTGFRCVVSE